MNASISRMTVSDIAKLAGVQKSTVSNWRRRHSDFPQPLSEGTARPQFDTHAVRAWLSSRNLVDLVEDGRATEVVRNWRYTVNHVECDEAVDIMILFIAAVEGQELCYEDSWNERYPVSISLGIFEASIRATQSQADAIRDFLATEIQGVDKAELLEAAAMDFDDLSRWRRTADAVDAERNLHNLLADLVHEESKTILDFACGTGAVMAAVSRRHPVARLTGIEADEVDGFVAEARLSGRAFAEVEWGDILKTDELKGRSFDAVACIPPFGRSVDTASDRMRRMPFGAVRGSADAAWPQLAVQALTAAGEAFLVLPHSLSFEDRSDAVRRELIRQGTVAAVITLPANALASTRTLSDLWMLRSRREPSAKVLFVDFAAAEPSSPDEYDVLRRALTGWLDGGHLPTDDPRFTSVDAIGLLSQRVTLDPQYWCAHSAAPKSPDELLSAVANATKMLADIRQSLADSEVPRCLFVPEPSTMISVRDAREDELVEIPKKTGAQKTGPSLTVAQAEAMRSGDEISITGERVMDNDDALRPGDVLVWATADRQVRTAVSTIGGVVPSHPIAVLRCSRDLEPHYLAVALAAKRNAVYATGSTIPTIRMLELEFPLIPLEQQRQIADYVRAVRGWAQAGKALHGAVAALEDVLADAVGSGVVGIDEPDDAKLAAHTAVDGV